MKIKCENCKREREVGKMKERIKLNHKCNLCKKAIYINERFLLKPKPFHLDCAVKKLKESNVVCPKCFSNFSLKSSFEDEPKEIDKIFGEKLTK